MACCPAVAVAAEGMQQACLPFQAEVQVQDFVGWVSEEWEAGYPLMVACFDLWHNCCPAMEDPQVGHHQEEAAQSAA